MKCKILKILGVALVVSISLNARTPQKAYASTNDLFSKSSSSVAYFVTGMAKIYGVNPDMALFIALHESQLSWRGNVYNPSLEGDDGNSRGLWQISKIYHPEVSDKCADDIVCSTEWAMPQIKKNPDQWSTWKYRVKWFGY